MNWITIILLSAFVLQVLGKQSSNNNGVKSKRNSGQRTVRLDPLLRKALLRALTELEREAQEKIKQEEEEKLKSEKKEVGKRGNDLQESDVDSSVEEIQKTADTKYPTPAPIVNNPPETDPPQEITTTTTIAPEITEPPPPVTIKDAFFFHTPTPIQHDFTSPAVQITKKPEPTLSPPEVESNLIAEPKVKENFIEATDKPEEVPTVKPEPEVVTTKPEPEKVKSSDDNSEVELFQAPLVAAFTLHQDHRGTPHSVVPLIRNLPIQNQNFFQQQQQQPQHQQQQPQHQQQQPHHQQQQPHHQQQQPHHQQQQPQHQQQHLHQQRFINRPQQLRQQQQFIPSVTITPLSQPNNLNQGQRAFSSTNIPTSTAFPPLSSNSIVPSSFQASVIPSQTFEIPSTIAPIRNNNNIGFGSTPAPFISSTVSFASTPAPFISTTAPPRNFSPGSTVKPPTEIASDVSIVQSHVFNLPTPPSQLVAPAITPQQSFTPFNIPPVTLPLQNEPRFPFSFQDNQSFLDRQKRVEEQNKQKQVEEFNRLRFLEQQKRQQQIQNQNRFRQTNKAAELRQEGFEQRPDQGLDFQRSVGFSFEITPKPIVNRLPQVTFDIQQSRHVAFEDIETRNRVNRQEAFGSTGNFGFNRPVNQIPQFPKDQRGFQNNQVQFQPQLNSFQQLQQYRTIPDEHYRALEASRFQQLQQINRFQPNNFQFRQPIQFQPAAPPVTKQLENLLIQSGVAAGDASRQEDLNIVSKVLALNHQRSDTNFEESRRVDRNDRTAPEVLPQDLLVGEISETSKFNLRK